MGNLHISLTEFRNETRVLKQTKSILENNVANSVYIAALHGHGLQEKEVRQENLIIDRFKLKSKSLKGSVLFTFIKFIEFCFRVFFFYRKKKIDFINVHELALLPLGVLLKSAHGAKLVYDAHELETETINSFGIRKKLKKTVERLLIKKADIVFVVSENIADWYEQHYRIERPVVVLNAPKLTELNAANNLFRESLGIKASSKICLYQGGLTKGRGCKLLLDAFSERNNDDVVMVFMGYGELEKEIKNMAAKKANIFFHPAVPPEVVLKYTASADFGISYIENRCLSYYYCMPNKFFEYAMAGLPVIISDMKEMREMLEKYQMGLVVENESIEAINNAINKIQYLDIEKFKANAQKCAEENSWEKQETKMIERYKQLFIDTI